jgi:hypothetical protein
MMIDILSVVLRYSMMTLMVKADKLLLAASIAIIIITFIFNIIVTVAGMTSIATCWINNMMIVTRHETLS